MNLTFSLVVQEGQSGNVALLAMRTAKAALAVPAHLIEDERSHVGRHPKPPEALSALGEKRPRAPASCWIDDIAGVGESSKGGQETSHIPPTLETEVLGDFWA